MGVPAFYRWVQEKYPKCVVDCVEARAVELEGERHFELTDTTGPNPNGFEVDNLYVDMNGLIHPCAHPENGEPPKTEEEMYRRVMAYVDRLVAAVRPRRVLYLAIDGVAPRAKMNQQRARRFRAAQEAEQRTEVEREAVEYMKALGHKVPDNADKHWDSNVITPGTKFMAKLAKYLRFYIRDRVNNNAAWKSLKVRTGRGWLVQCCYTCTDRMDMCADHSLGRRRAGRRRAQADAVRPRAALPAGLRPEPAPRAARS